MYDIYMKNDESMMESLRKIFVTIEVFNLRFTPIEKIVYGFTGLILTGFFTAVIAFFITQRK